MFDTRFNARQKETASSYSFASSVIASPSTSQVTAVSFVDWDSNTNNQTLLAELGVDSSTLKSAEPSLIQSLLNKKARDDLAELRSIYDRNKINANTSAQTNPSENTNASSSCSSHNKNNNTSDDIEKDNIDINKKPHLQISNQFDSLTLDSGDVNLAREIVDEGTLKFGATLGVRSKHTLSGSSSNSLDKNNRNSFKSMNIFFFCFRLIFLKMNTSYI